MAIAKIVVGITGLVATFCLWRYFKADGLLCVIITGGLCGVIYEGLNSL